MDESTRMNGLANLKLMSSVSKKEELIAIHFTAIMQILGLDMSNDSLKKTPSRVAKMYVNEVFKGLDETLRPEVSLFENENNYDGMILVNGIELYSYCEHHFVPFFGTATIAYYPNKKVIGLSKINRIVEFLAQKPSIQERLTKEIADEFVELLETDNVAVYVKAMHLCVASRGIKHGSSSTITTVFRGDFQKENVKAEFISKLALK